MRNVATPSVKKQRKLIRGHNKLLYFISSYMNLFSWRHLKEPEKVLKMMLNYKPLPQHIESVFIHNILKLFAHIMERYELEEEHDKILELCDLISAKLQDSLKSAELEVQERSSTCLSIIEIVKEEIDLSKYSPFTFISKMGRNPLGVGKIVGYQVVKIILTFICTAVLPVLQLSYNH